MDFNLIASNLLAAVETQAPAETSPPVDTMSSLQAVFHTIENLWLGFMGRLPLIVVGLIVIVVTKYASSLFQKSADKLLSRFNLLESQKTLLSRFGCITIWAIGISTTVMVIFPNVTPGKFLAGLGIGSIAIGFAFKDIFENFFAGILILWHFPFENGDVIECQGIVGVVEDVTIRNTLLRKASGELVVMPNSTIFMNSVDVLTDQKLRRVSITTGIGYGEDIDKAREIIRQAVSKCPTVNQDKPVDVFAKEFASSSIDFAVLWWTESHPASLVASRDEGIEAIKIALDAAGIEIPFPHRTLTLNEPLDINLNSDKTG
jgi:small conductance mechanosensitive channel